MRPRQAPSGPIRPRQAPSGREGSTREHPFWQLICLQEREGCRQGPHRPPQHFATPNFSEALLGKRPRSSCNGGAGVQVPQEEQVLGSLLGGEVGGHWGCCLAGSAWRGGAWGTPGVRGRAWADYPQAQASLLSPPVAPHWGPSHPAPGSALVPAPTSLPGRWEDAVFSKVARWVGPTA